MRRFLKTSALLLVGALGFVAAAGAAGSQRCQTVTSTVYSTVYSTVVSTVHDTTTVTVTAPTTTEPPPPPPPPPTRQAFDVTEPAGTPGFPRDPAYCASHILLNTWEPLSHGNMTYNVPRDDLGTSWSDPRFAWWTSFPLWWNGRRLQIDDNYANGVTDHAMTTTEAFSFAACRWGIREDLLRAVAVQESDWHEHGSPGDQCSGRDINLGYGSFGIMQVKNYNCSDQGDWGGFPRTWYSTFFNVDFYGAAFRACLEQDFWYTIPSTDDNATREKGCVGAWYIGHYDTFANGYVPSVYTHLANRDWLSYS